MAAPDPTPPTRAALEEMAPDKRTARALELAFVQLQEQKVINADFETRLAAAEATIAAEHP